MTDGFIRTVTDKSDPDHLKHNTSNRDIDLCALCGQTPEQTAALRDLVTRNIANPESLAFFGMTQPGLQRE
ncbi:hypothetical protein [uncultured Roseobacter sp.]|uniref:hypothetical protein n=1 Tax=uncultured Roseobacter sp. TaxID=114847 RepID=UPI002623310F|nr:hypothetical protein [uncultured Roseobacter sp.]